MTSADGSWSDRGRVCGPPYCGTASYGRGARWEALFDALIGGLDPIAREVRERVQEHYPSFGAIEGESLDPMFRSTLERVLTDARARTAGSAEAFLTEVGESQARQGIALEELLSTWSLVLEIYLDRVNDIGRTLGMDSDDKLDFLLCFSRSEDAVLRQVAGGHRRIEIERARQDQEHRAEFLRGVLFGGMTAADITTCAGLFGIDTTREYVAVRGHWASGSSRLELEQSLGFHQVLPHRRGVCGLLEGDLAGFMAERPTCEVPGVVGVGPGRRLDALSESFRLASRALSTGIKFRLRGILDLEGLGVRPAVAADTDVGEAMCRRYLDPLVGSGMGRELVASLRTYFAAGRHVDKAAEELFIHPNTLRYRISRFEELTGVSLRDPSALVEIWWALEAAAIRPEANDL